jgi:hypothetical protein
LWFRFRLRGEVDGWIIKEERLGEADLSVSVEFLKAVVLRHGLTRRFSRQVIAFSPVSRDSHVSDRDRDLDGHHETRLHDTHHATESTLDGLGALAA